MPLKTFKIFKGIIPTKFMISLNYKEFESRIKEIHQIGIAEGMLNWDLQTYMPTQGIDQRSSVISLLDRIRHEMIINPHLAELLQYLEKSSQLSPIQTREIVLFRRKYDRATKLPAEFVQKLSKQSAITLHKWQKAKQNSNFALIKPELAKLIELTKQKAHYLNPDENPWDVLGHDFEPNVKGSQIMELFKPLKAGVLKLIERFNKAMEICDEVPHTNLLDVPIEISAMKKLTNWQMKLVGLDPDRSRVDESEHPFTTGYLDDVRITTHYLQSQPLASIYSVFHEAGHALYDLNLPHSEAWTFHGDSISSGIHESQSRFIENLIGKHPAFLEYFFPLLKQYIPAYEKFNSYDFIRAVNAIMPSKIRIYADEVTYNLHIILRFEIEQALFNEEITIDELPSVWNEKMKLYLNQDILNDTEGVLQDMHWFTGYYGYFPDYALGNLYNGHMLHYLKADIPEYADLLREGNLSSILSWLKTKVHQKGNMADPLEFIEHMTGEPLNPHYFLDYLDLKYTEIFHLG